MAKKCVKIPGYTRGGKQVKTHVRCFETKDKNDGGEKGQGKTGGSASANQDAEINDLMDMAKVAGPEVDGIGKEYAQKYGGSVTDINYKSFGSIKRKVNDEENGIVGNIKDSVRNTVMIKKNQIDSVAEDLKNDPRFVRVKVQRPEDYDGYSGIIANVKTKNGLTAEIQFNVPGMLYAKGDRPTAEAVLGKKKFGELARKTKKKCCEGHVYYEGIRGLMAKKKNGTISQNEEKELTDLKNKSVNYYRQFYDY